jgi:hypothetical protein
MSSFRRSEGERAQEQQCAGATAERRRSIGAMALNAEEQKWADLNETLTNLEADVNERLEKRSVEMRREMRAMCNVGAWKDDVSKMMASFEKKRSDDIEMCKREIEDGVIADACSDRDRMRKEFEEELEKEANVAIRRCRENAL